MDRLGRPITSPEEMISLIRTVGIIPFSKGAVPGWSVQEQTDPDFWFTTSDQLGPWDWKVEAVRDGIVYGKYVSRKSTFATEDIYRHLMNWRRSLPQYRMAEGGRYKAATINDRLMKHVSPALLSAIRSHETLEYSELRSILEKEVPMEERKKVGGYIGRHLIPKVTRQAVDFVMQYLDMGTWTVVGDITRVYRGPNCEYKGWQRNSVTTPDLLFSVMESQESAPFWAKFIEAGSASPQGAIDCTPEESRTLIISRILSFFPNADVKVLEKLI